jgi:anti-sigma regulatory factor (Ser/Thr protein kinase)
MTEQTIDDLFSLEQPDSLVRRVFAGKRLSLSGLDLKVFVPGETYTIVTFNICEGEDVLDYLEQIRDVSKEGRHTGKHERFHSGVYEAVRNAFQHGNKKDPSKKVIISYKSTDDAFEVVVADEGGSINGNFAPFVLFHRNGLPDKPNSFYKFAPEVERLEENSGIGTYIIHSVSDEVNYFINENGGLSVQMTIKK